MHLNRKEEIANAISHGAGVVFGLAAMPVLVYNAMRGGNADLPVFPYVIYGLCFVFLFLASTAYHLTHRVSVKETLQKLDHMAIYFMIAGSYTPFIFACLHGMYQWLFVGLMWSIVLAGSVFKWFYTGKFENLSLLIYLSMGWMVIFMIRPFLEQLDPLTIGLVIAGGVFYTAGVYFYARDHRAFHHFIWHLFVLAGSVMHYLAILLTTL